MKQKHAVKKENLENISKLKKKISSQGGDIEDRDFHKIMYKGKEQDSSEGSKGAKRRILDKVRGDEMDKKRQRNSFKPRGDKEGKGGYKGGDKGGFKADKGGFKGDKGPKGGRPGKGGPGGVSKKAQSGGKGGRSGRFGKAKGGNRSRQGRN